MRIKDASIAIGGIAVVLLITMLGFTSKKEQAACINIFYDQTVNSDYEDGRRFSGQLSRLLRAMTPMPQVVRPVEHFQSGDFEKCNLNFYIGSYPENKLPRDFLHDYVRTRKKVLWMGYNIWQLGEQLESRFGLRFIRLTTLDPSSLGSEEKTAYFSEVLYKGRVYVKSSGGGLSPLGQRQVPFEQVELLPTNLDKFDALAEARHSRTREVIPYIVRADNRYYVADIPNDLEANPLLSDVLRDLQKVD